MIEVGFQDVVEARARMAGVVAPTPLVLSEPLSELAGGEAWLKLDNLLFPVGSFKLRGAFNKISGLSAEERAAGLVAVSAGNHSQAVAFCAGYFGLDAVVFMPENAPRVKVRNTERLGARVALKGWSYDEASACAREFEQSSGRVFIHPFDDPAVIAGQGTAALEVLDRLPEADAVIIPVGGGGLLGGCGCALRGAGSTAEIIGVQPEASRPFVDSFEAGRRLSPPIGDSLADALTGEIVSDEFFEFFRQWPDRMLAVSEAAIADAVYWMLENHSMVIEGGAAAAIAPVLDGGLRLRGRKAVFIITGCGLDPGELGRIIEARAAS